MREVVEEAEDDGEGLLHAQESVEGPFAVELEDGLTVWRVAGFSLVGYDVLADVVALRRARPQKEASLEGFARSGHSYSFKKRTQSFIRIGLASLPQFASLHTYGWSTMGRAE